MATVADRIAEWLHEKGFTHAFGIIGGGNVALWDAITRLKKTQIVCVHHEQAAAMASGYFNRIRRGLRSISLVTTGAGSTNTITGVMAAYMDRAPLLVISGNEASKYFEELRLSNVRVNGVQGYPSAYVARPFTSWAEQTIFGAEALQVLEVAASKATKPPYGPVWVDIPKDVQGARV